ncbi:MAG: rhomboid family intramembrane serine protease [Myxococcales bacterium]|nr:rhomboid family intramembrane serine protease [Myxococcales bacterium]
MRHLPTLRTNDGLGGEIRRIFSVMAVFLAALWAIELVDVAIFHGGLDRLGIMPRSATGLLGILAAPFLHSGWDHLASNTIGIVMLGGLTLAVGRREFLAVTLAGVVVGGVGTWLFGRPSIHLGASGLVFAYLGYLMLRGWYDRRFGSIALTVLVGWFYGSMIFGMIPLFTPARISWEGHLFGFLGGVLTARMLHRRS